MGLAANQFSAINCPSSRIDQTQLSAIASGMSEVVLEILADFSASFEREFAEFSQCPSSVAAARWQDFFHRVKGSSGTLGLSDLQEAGAKLEAKAKKGDLPSKVTLAEFRGLMRESCEEARTILSSL